jgi:ABC-type transport system substrate-binding protein
VHRQTKRIHRALGAALVAAAAATTLAACGGGGSGTTAAGGSSATAAAAGATTATTASTGQAQATVGFPGKLLTLDPDQAIDTGSLAALHLIGGNLYEFDSDGKVHLGLAAKGTESADHLSWTLALRPDLTFSDGTPLTASDVKATFDRATADKANAYAGVIAEIKAVTAPSPSTVVIDLKHPNPSLPTVLAEPGMMILPAKGIAKGASFFDAPVSAGPYRLSSWGGGPTAQFARNDSYVGAKPAVENVTFQTIPDYNTRLAQVQAGQIDFAVDLPPSLLAHISGNVHGDAVAQYGFIKLVPRNDVAPLDQRGIRVAISKAVDRQQINDVVWLGKNRPIADFWPSTMAGYDPNVSTAQDLDGARKALAGTACEHGCTLELLYNTGFAWTAPTALVIQSNLEKIGIKLKLAATDGATYFQRSSKGKFQMSLGFLSDYADIPDGMAAYGLETNGGLDAGFSGFSNPEMDAAIRHADQSSGAERDAALAQINTLFDQMRPYATLLDYALVTASRVPADLIRLSPAGFVEIGREGGA